MSEPSQQRTPTRFGIPGPGAVVKVRIVVAVSIGVETVSGSAEEGGSY